MGLDIQKVANEADDGMFTVRTNGLHSHRHPELEIAPIPRAAVETAAKLIDYVIELVVERKGTKLMAGENVGLPLSVGGHEEIPAVFVGVHAAESEPPSGGFFAKVRGADNKGVLRLTDMPGPQPGPPLAALASMMLYRANCRFVLGDVAGAITELQASIEMMPGDPKAGPPPSFDTNDADLNWQNHQSYLRLAELVQPEERSPIYRAVFSRFGWLASRDLGCGPDALTGATEGALHEEATSILKRNLAHPGDSPGPHAGLLFVASPLWTARDDGIAIREAAMIPEGFVDYYFGGRLASPDAAQLATRLAARCVAQHAGEPWTVSFMTKGARAMYCGSGLPAVDVTGNVYRPSHFLLSAVMAETARYLHAGATIDELHAAFAIGGHAAEVRESLSSKVNALETWETEQYSRGIGVGILQPRPRC
jgi:hypothetical protein